MSNLPDAAYIRNLRNTGYRDGKDPTYGESEDWEIGVADEATVCIPLSRYDELLRSESEIDILCTLYADEGVSIETAIEAWGSIAEIRSRRLDCDSEDDTDEE